PSSCHFCAPPPPGPAQTALFPPPCPAPVRGPPAAAAPRELRGVSALLVPDVDLRQHIPGDALRVGAVKTADPDRSRRDVVEGGHLRIAHRQLERLPAALPHQRAPLPCRPTPSPLAFPLKP